MECGNCNNTEKWTLDVDRTETYHWQNGEWVSNDQYTRKMHMCCGDCGAGTSGPPPEMMLED